MQARLSEDAIQAQRLQSLLGFKEQFISKTVAAQVIGSSGSDLSRSIYIDKGENAGLKPDMAVITAGGIVGKVWLVYPSTSLVLMINDQSSGVGVFLEKSRLQGVLRGTPNGELILERVMNDEQVAPGDVVLSSGGDQIFPKGLPVGTVSKAGPGREMFLNVKVNPAADLSRLEEVLVVTQKEEREAVAEGGTKMRAADILARRLPSVPDKLAAVAGSAAAGNAASAKPQPNATGKPATGEVQKKVVQKTASVDSDTNAAGSAAVDRHCRWHFERYFKRCWEFSGETGNGASPRLRHLNRCRKRLRNPLPPKIVPTSVPITYTSEEQIEVYRFSIPVTVGVPLLALFLQAFLPRRIPYFSYLDLPLLVTIYFGMARRNPISGLLTGAAIGLVQDMLGPHPIGIYGIAKTVVGYLASSLGVKA